MSVPNISRNLLVRLTSNLAGVFLMILLQVGLVERSQY